MGSVAHMPPSYCPLRQQLCDSKQVVCSSHEPSRQVRSAFSLKPCFPKPSNYLEPAPNLFNPFPNPLANCVASVPRRPTINRRSSSSLRVLSHVRRNLSAPQHGDKALGIVPLICPQAPRGDSFSCLPLQHRLGCFLLRCAGGLGYVQIHQKTIAVLHQKMSSIREFRFLPSAFSHQATLRIRRRLMSLVASLLPVKVHRGIARVSVGRSIRGLLSFGPKALHARPGFNQGPVHRKVIRAHQPGTFP